MSRPQRLVIAVLSDIHFRRYENGALDLDSDLRNELLIDAGKKAKEFEESDQQVYGVIVCGDVAYSGGAAEYEDARSFLKQLCTKISCPSENVWMIPGNHDVNRTTISQSHLLKTLHQQPRLNGGEFVDSWLHTIVKDTQSRDLILSPIEEYNLFAGGYGGGCAVNQNRFFWEQDLPLNDGSVLRIRGINSTLISGPTDNNGSDKLLVGEMQTQIHREDGVTFMALCHHPPDWLLDGDAIIDALDKRAAINIFGHKHRQRISGGGNHPVTIAAGAVQPPRGEGSIPFYNWLSLWVEQADTGNERLLNVHLHTRRWHDSERCFVTDYDSNDEPLRKAKVNLRPWSGLVNSIADQTTGTTGVGVQDTVTTGLGSASKQSPIQQNEGKDMMINPERRLMHRFFGLPYPSIIKVAANMELIDEEDRGARDPERFQRYFQRAKDRGQMSHLWTQVAKQYGDEENVDNPFLSHEEQEGSK